MESFDQTTLPPYDNYQVKIFIECECGSTYYHTGEVGYCWDCKKVDLHKYEITFDYSGLKTQA